MDEFPHAFGADYVDTTATLKDKYVVGKNS